jgi:hypothetical protein
MYAFTSRDEVSWIPPALSKCGICTAQKQIFGRRKVSAGGHLPPVAMAPVSFVLTSSHSGRRNKVHLGTKRCTCHLLVNRDQPWNIILRIALISPRPCSILDSGWPMWPRLFCSNKLSRGFYSPATFINGTLCRENLSPTKKWADYCVRKYHTILK